MAINFETIKISWGDRHLKVEDRLIKKNTKHCILLLNWFVYVLDIIDRLFTVEENIH